MGDRRPRPIHRLLGNFQPALIRTPSPPARRTPSTPPLRSRGRPSRRRGRTPSPPPARRRRGHVPVGGIPTTARARELLETQRQQTTRRTNAASRIQRVFRRRQRQRQRRRI